MIHSGNNQQLIDAAKKRFVENEQMVMKEYDRKFSMKNYWFDRRLQITAGEMELPAKESGGLQSHEVAPYARGSIDCCAISISNIPNFTGNSSNIEQSIGNQENTFRFQ
jgi:hypothetical protein